MKIEKRTRNRVVLREAKNGEHHYCLTSSEILFLTGEKRFDAFAIRGKSAGVSFCDKVSKKELHPKLYLYCAIDFYNFAKDTYKMPENFDIFFEKGMIDADFFKRLSLSMKKIKN